MSGTIGRRQQNIPLEIGPGPRRSPRSAAIARFFTSTICLYRENGRHQVVRTVDLSLGGAEISTDACLQVGRHPGDYDHSRHPGQSLSGRRRLFRATLTPIVAFPQRAPVLRSDARRSPDSAGLFFGIGKKRIPHRLTTMGERMTGFPISVRFTRRALERWTSDKAPAG